MSANDYCVVCGKYIPEGYGMVCPDCLKTYSLMLEHKKEIISILEKNGFKPRLVKTRS